MFLVPTFLPKTIEDLSCKDFKDDSDEIAEKEAQLKSQFLQLRGPERSRVPVGLHDRPGQAGTSPRSSEEFQQGGVTTDNLQAGSDAERSDDMVDAGDEAIDAG